MSKHNLEKAAEAINKDGKKEIAYVGKEAEKALAIEPMSTGIPMLDFELGIGGLPKGRICEIYGQPSSTKTSMALFMIGAAQRQGLSCAFIDAEFALDTNHAKAMGVDMDSLLVVRPDCGEEAFTVMETLLLNDEAQFIVVDSVSGMVPRGDAEADMGTSQMGSQARLMSYSLRKLINPVAKSKGVVLFINQLRVNIMGGQWDPFMRPGGQALRFYTSVVIELKKTDKLESAGELVGYTTKFSIKKNKVGKPNGTGELQYFFDRGFEGGVDVLEAGERAGLITKTGITYFFGEHKLAAGKDKARAALIADPALLSSLSEALGQSLSQ